MYLPGPWEAACYHYYQEHLEPQTVEYLPFVVGRFVVIPLDTVSLAAVAFGLLEPVLLGFEPSVVEPFVLATAVHTAEPSPVIMMVPTAHTVEPSLQSRIVLTLQKPDLEECLELSPNQ